MKFRWALVGCLLAIFFASCASQTTRNKDVKADEALGTAGYEEQAAEAEDTLQQSQTQRRREQQQALERQVTDPKSR